MCLTPPGPAGIAVVRLTGPLVAAFLGDHFSREAVPGRCVHGQLSDGGAVIDDPVVVVAADRSLADLNLHGGPWIVRRVIEMASRAGFETEPTWAFHCLTPQWTVILNWPGKYMHGCHWPAQNWRSRPCLPRRRTGPAFFAECPKICHTPGN